MNRAMPEINRRQALVIEGAHILPNDRGTAPGQWIEEAGAVVMMLPGPPHELKAMFTRQCLPRLQRIVPPLAIRTLELRVSGMSESDLDQAIAPIYKNYENPVTTILAHNGDMQVHLRARCATEGESHARCWPKWAARSTRCWATGSIRATAIRSKRWSASNCWLCMRRWRWPRARPAAGWPSASPASPAVPPGFVGGFITYTKRMKTELLGVPAEILDRVRRGQRGDGRGHGDAARAAARARPGRSRSRATPGPPPTATKRRSA